MNKIPDLNSVVIRGTVADEPKINAAGNYSVAKLRVRTSEFYRDRRSGETRESTQYHSVQAWGELAEYCKSIRPGSSVEIWGQLTTRKYEDRYITEIKAQQILGFDINLFDAPEASESRVENPRTANESMGDFPF